jgi:hypothetical protein
MKSATQIFQINTGDRRQVRQFLDLPLQIYRNIPQWVPPLRREAARMLDRRRHPFYRHSEAAFFLALDRSGNAIGRLAVLENRNYNTFNHCRQAFFYLFECEDDLLSARALFSAGCEWASARGLDEISGPKGFSALDGMGLLVDGYEHRPAFGIPYNPAYYARLVEAAGLVPAGELVSGYLSRAGYQLPEKVHQVAELVKRRRGLHIARFKTRSDLSALLPKLQQLYNNSLGGTSGNVPLTTDEVQAMANQILWFADPSLIKIVMKDNEPVGFLFAYPDISAAVQRSGGRLFPTGWAYMLLELRRTKWINVNGAGMVENYRGLGGTALLFSELYKTVAESRYEHADMVQIGVENDRMQRELQELGIDFYKRHRMYCRRTIND